MSLSDNAPGNPWRDATYEELVAAYLLRSPQFAARHASLLQRVEGAFFGNFLLDDLVRCGLDHFVREGEVLPPPALIAQVAHDSQGASAHSYKIVCDKVFSLPLEGENHVTATLVSSVQERALAELETRRESMFHEGEAGAYFKSLHEIERLGYAQGTGMVSLTHDLDSLLLDDGIGTSTGFPSLDGALSAQGLTGGELLLVIGNPNVGKTQILHHIARSAIHQDLRVVVLTLETSHKNTRLRILRGMTGWQSDEVKDNPAGFRAAVDALGDIKLHVKHEPAASGYSIGSLEADIDRVQQETGDKVGFVVRDYGELMAADVGAWQDVRRSYLDFKAMLGRLGIPGADACQRNKAEKISFYDLLKDADVGMTVAETEPGGSRLVLDVVRVREGARVTFSVLVDRASGLMKEMTMDPGELETQDE